MSMSDERLWRQSRCLQRSHTLGFSLLVKGVAVFHAKLR